MFQINGYIFFHFISKAVYLRVTWELLFWSCHRFAFCFVLTASRISPCFIPDINNVVSNFPQKFPFTWKKSVNSELPLCCLLDLYFSCVGPASWAITHNCNYWKLALQSCRRVLTPQRNTGRGRGISNKPCLIWAWDILCIYQNPNASYHALINVCTSTNDSAFIMDDKFNSLTRCKRIC